MKKIGIDSLADALGDLLNDYAEEVTEAVKTSAKDIAKECKADIKKASPRNTGEYAKGWGYTTIKENKQVIGIAVHNKKEPQLTHLLEKGHAKVNGGRVEGKPHIGPAEQKAVKKFVDEIKKAAKGD